MKEEENIVKIAFNIYCNMIYGKQYPFTINNVLIFFKEVNEDFKNYYEYNYNLTDYGRASIREIILNQGNVLKGHIIEKYFKHFIKQYKLLYDNYRNNS